MSTTKARLATARASISGLLDKPATPEELDNCIFNLDEIISAVYQVPNLPAFEQREATRVIASSLTDIKNLIKRRPK